ncbi:flagellar hook-associated protein FlgL [Paenibacillus cremeus]|uniref:Flagellar hook-associated protein 3 n=1 Tax=Paenibacillus cremeus TaxID=2163881 RepID=A0A559KB62_9BACL|nr:flagellar hook-associated protein FlgL [Paenibacillus cremeus]TVY09333.1 flagellar hook-associated protein 3 [Paenibacillus cremeus]
MNNRITQNMISSQLLRNLNTNLNRMSTYQDQMATSRKINKPSDDPVGLSYAMRYRSDLTANDQYQQNVDSANSWLDFTDTMMGQANDVLQRIRELTVQAAQGSNPDTAMQSIKSELLQLTDQLVTVGNSQFNGKYVFNGQMTDVAPYNKQVTQVQPSISVGGTVDVSTANVTNANNKLSLRIDNGQELNIQLPPTDYSVSGGAAQFATDLQNAINAAASSLSPASSASVTVGPANELVITSSNGGPGGRIEITGGTMAYQWLSKSRDMSDLVQTPNTQAPTTVTKMSAQFSNSDTKDINFEIATGIKMPVNITGDKIFGKSTDSDNVFRVMNELVNSIDRSDYSGVSDLLGKLDSRINKGLEVRAELGAKSNRVQLSADRLSDISTNLQALQSKTEDADMAELITNLKTAENVYNASLSVGSKVISPTLVDFLR